MCAKFIVFCAESDILHYAPLFMFMKVLLINSFNVASLLSMSLYILSLSLY